MYSPKDSLGGLLVVLAHLGRGQNGPINRLPFYRCSAVAGAPRPAYLFTGVNFGLLRNLLFLLLLSYQGLSYYFGRA